MTVDVTVAIVDLVDFAALAAACHRERR